MTAIPPLSTPPLPQESSSAISSLPNEMTLAIFQYLDPIDLGRVCQVSRLWNQLGSEKSLWLRLDLKQIFPHHAVIDTAFWHSHFDLNQHGLASPNRVDVRKVAELISRLKECPRESPIESLTIIHLPQGLDMQKLSEMRSRLAPNLGITSFAFQGPLKTLGRFKDLIIGFVEKFSSR